MPDLIGTVLAQYRIDSLIGEGGMGSVFRGWDTSLARPVAVKVMHTQFAKQPEFRDRFLQEAKAPARLSHPSIVHIYNFGSHKGFLYIVMEYVPGATLSAFLRQAGESGRVVHLKETLVVLSQVADALAYAHQNGVIHRDIKPDNILLRRLDHPDRDGDPPLRATVTDFGLAKLLEGGVDTQTGAFLGTLSYMSPEQCFGQSLDGRSDVYSLGVVLYRLTTGRLPLEIISPTDAILKHQQVVPPPPRQLRPGLPAEVEKIIQRAIQKNPADRYSDAGELFRDLRRAADRLSDIELNDFAPTEQVFSLATLPEKADEQSPSRPGLLDKAGLTPGGAPENRIHIMVPEKTIRSMAVSTGSLVVGRGEDCDITIDDPLISRQHARIDYDGQKFSVVDLNSTNGTYLEDTRLLEGVREIWNPIKLVRVGNSWLRLELAIRPRRSSTAAFPDSIPSTEDERALSQFSSLTGRVTIFLAQDTFILQPGHGAAIPVLILNQGSIVDHFRLSLKALPAEWTAAIPVAIHLMPGERGETKLSLPAPPPNLPAGDYQVQVLVSGEASPEEAAVANIVLRVSPRLSFEMDLQPQKHRSLSKGRFALEIRNRGNAPLDLQLSAQDPENACEYIFSPNPARIPAQQDLRVSLVVQSHGRLPNWEGKTYPFTVTARLAGEAAAPSLAQGEWVQAPPEIEVRVQPPNQRTYGRANFTVQLTSFSPEICEIDLEAADPDAACTYELSPRRVQVSAGEPGQSALWVLPKGGHPNREVQFTVSAHLVQAPHLARQATGRWQPVPPQIAVSLTPARQRSSRQATYVVGLKSECPLPLDLALSAADAGGQLVYSLRPDRLQLPANATRTVDLTVQAPNPRVAQTHVLTVAVRLAGGAEILQQVAGEWQQEAEVAVMDLPEPVTIAKAASLPEPVRMEEVPQRRTVGCLALLFGLVLTAVLGFTAGNLVSNIFRSPVEPWIAAITVWSLGLWMSVRWYKRVRG